MNSDLKWYILQTYSGHENKVKGSIDRLVESRKLGDEVAQVKIPTMEVVEMHNGKKRIVKKKFMPGYILVEMIMTEASEYELRKLSSVSGFVGSKGPQALSEEELKNIFTEMGELVDNEEKKKAPRIMFTVGERVNIVDGPFASFSGVVDEIYPDKGRMRVKVEIFGRSTPVELDYLQVGKV